MSDVGDADDNALDIFEEPAGYFEPEKQPTTVSHTTLNGQTLSLRLIGHSPLWVGDRIPYHISDAINHLHMRIFESAISQT